MTDSFPAQLAGPSSKERKYDRQLRLWAASGQQALEDSRILLVNSDGPLDNENVSISGVVGVETLKNLILPGIGGFTIVDPAVVTETDLGVNFFLEGASLGKSRAEETCKFLRELNPEVEGGFSNQPILELLKEEEFLPAYRLIIITAPMKHSTLKVICDAASSLAIPVIYTHSVGFYSSFSLQLPSLFPVVETHPDPDSIQDLRLTNPWPELAAAAQNLPDLDTLDDHEHGHVPYLLLLLHYLEKWKVDHDGQYPANYKEKTEFREIVRRGARTNNTEGGEENFDEAVSAVLKSINKWNFSSGLREIFEMEQCASPNKSSASFWIIASAIRSFFMSHGVLPVPGSLPDMKAQSADYIKLQNIYKTKARQDVAEVEANVRAIESKLAASAPLIPPITTKEIETFCKNAAHIKVIQGREIPCLHIGDEKTIKAIRQNLENPESQIPIYIALQLLDLLVTDYHMTQDSSSTPNSTSYLDNSDNWSNAMNKFISSLQTDNNTLSDEAVARVSAAAEEVKRAGAGELHNISSLAGGLVAQEALKVLTKQYVPLDNTFVFDGIGSKGEMFRL